MDQQQVQEHCSPIRIRFYCLIGFNIRLVSKNGA